MKHLLSIGALVLTGFSADVIAADTTPNAFHFTDKTGAQFSTVYKSNKITVKGINAPAPIGVTGGSYSIGCNGTFTEAAGTIMLNQTVCVQQTSAATASTSTDTTLTIGGVSDTYTVTTQAADSTPAQFTLIDKTGVDPGVAVTSTPVAIKQTNTPAAISITGGTYSINCGADNTYTSASGMVDPGSSVCVRNTSSSTPGAAVVTKLTVGGVSDNFSSTTADASATGTLAPFALSNGTIKLADFTKPFGAANPVVIATAVDPGTLQNARSWITGTVSGTTVSNIRTDRLTLVKAGKVIGAKLTAGTVNNTAQISTIADACSIDGHGENIQNTANSWAMIRRAGPDAQCSTSDDSEALVRLNFKGTDAPVLIDGLNRVDGIFNQSTGALVGFITVEAGPSLVHRDVNMANPVVIMSLSSSNVERMEVLPSKLYYKLTAKGQAHPQLFRYDETTNSTTISPALYTFTQSTGFDGALDNAAYDGSNVYFGDGTNIVRVAHSASDQSTAAIVATVPDGETISQIALPDFSATRLVISTFNFSGFGGGIYSAVKTATAGTLTVLAQNELTGPTFNNLVIVNQGTVFINRSIANSSASQLRVNVDGTNPVETANAYWAGVSLDTSFDFSAHGTNNGGPPVVALVQATVASGNATLQTVDPSTFAVGLTLGTINSVDPMPTIFGFGFGRYLELVAEINRSGAVDSDVYSVDVQTANSLHALATSVHDDLPIGTH
ncbi:MAG TPA: hypothetical protein VHE37_02340 [Nevskiaceae bacterium]|nr:hypothetical protein [Nevskiaceae bacterium]